MTNALINLAFLRSLGPNYETFQQAMGDQTDKLKPGELYARIKAPAESKDEPELHHIAASDGSPKALAVRISNRRGGRQGGFRGRLKGKFVRPDNGGYRDFGRISKPYNSKGNAGSTPTFDGNKACRFCKRIGHVLDECCKFKWRNQQNRNNNRGRYSGSPLLFPFC
jgi:hypothetical protein